MRSWGAPKRLNKIPETDFGLTIEVSFALSGGATGRSGTPAACSESTAGESSMTEIIARRAFSPLYIVFDIAFLVISAGLLLWKKSGKRDT